VTPLERAGFLAHAGTAAFRRREAEALAVIERFVAVCRRPAISYSAGKDSEVMLHLVRRVAPATVAVFSDDEFNLPETLARLDAVPNLVRIAGSIRHTDWFTSWADGPAGLPAGTVWVEAEHNDGLGTWARAHGVDGYAIAIRANESWDRRRCLKKFGLLHQRPGGDWRCYPVGWWSLNDIWAYIAAYDLPYNRAYDVLSGLGVPAVAQRIGPFATVKGLPHGMIGWLRAGWPREFDRFAARCPEANQFA
jgi:3'-phosphoadenosine 5'-phosphosulfate sulfotransferase (PAPS reductase)/FAD synthetase